MALGSGAAAVNRKQVLALVLTLLMVGSSVAYAVAFAAL